MNVSPPAAPAERLALLFEWAQHDRRRCLGLWLLVALLLHAGAYALFRIEYPRPSPARINEGGFYVLLPGSPEAARLSPFLASADPGLFAPERATRAGIPPPTAPAYEPSYAARKPELSPLPEPVVRILPPLPQDFGPVPVPEAAVPARVLPPPATATQITASAALLDRLPQPRPPMAFTARPGDQLPPTAFLVAVAPDGRVLHVMRNGASVNPALDDAASRYVMALRFARGPDSAITWGTVTFHWGTDVQRRELE